MVELVGVEHFQPCTRKAERLGVRLQRRDARVSCTGHRLKSQSCYSLNLLNLVQTDYSDKPNPENSKILKILIQTNLKSQKSFHHYHQRSQRQWWQEQK